MSNSAPILFFLYSSNGNDAPALWPDHMKGYETAEACCSGYYGEGTDCEIVDKCEETTETSTTPEPSTTTQKTTTAATSNVVKSIKWWYSLNSSLPGGGECVHNADYPDNWVVQFAHHLYDSKDGCCANHQDVSCLIQDPVPTSKPTVPVFTNKPTTSPTPRASKWYFDDAADDCIEGMGYPDWMAAGFIAYTHLFSSKNDCCTVTGECSANPKAEKWWPQSDGSGGFVCTFNNDYPDTFIDIADSMLFETEEACCSIFCGLGTSSTMTATTAESVTTKAVTTTPKGTTTMVAAATRGATTTVDSDPFVDITVGFDSFDGLDDSKPFPWIFGSPEEWVRDTTHKLAGTGSLRNVAPTGNGESSTLSLKIRTTSPGVMKCYAFIETAMPYDSFSMEVNGVPRYVSYSPSNDWVTVGKCIV
jgi:hypothetical protein